MSLLVTVMSVTLLFSPIAAAMAYLTTYQEYARHLGKAAARRQSLNLALAAFLAFMLLGLLASFALDRIIR